MSRDFKIFLEDICEAVGRILEYSGKARGRGLAKNTLVMDAIIRNLMVIGEAAKSVPPEVRKKHPEVEWRKLCGLRDVLAHEYFGIKAEVIEDIVHNKLIDLRRRIRAILDEESDR